MTTLIRATRRQAFRGMNVHVETRDSRGPLTGELGGWGTQVIDVYPDDDARARGWNWKRHSVPVVGSTVSKVVTDDELARLAKLGLLDDESHHGSAKRLGD